MRYPFKQSITGNLVNANRPLENNLDFQYDPCSGNPLTWEDSYAIALALRDQHKQAHLEEISLGMIYHWTLALPEFCDDRELANEAILASIYQEWFELEVSL
jgi:FeS assembly protein IscX